jgi:tRNA A-37 threonylcarbamoyl transferase component Bud32
MAFVEINPKYRPYLERQGLTAPPHFLDLPGVVVSGHPDRHVVQVEVGSELRGFLKREHQVYWKDRLANAWLGFGLVSRSVREGRLLKALARARVGCPEFIAAGEDQRGRAFLLMRELSGFIELREFLRDHLSSMSERRRFARRLGKALAHLHAARFDHPDLYSKHVLVQPYTGAIRFLDWQRARNRRQVSLRQRWRDLAALHATLADNLATSRDRLACLQAYCSYRGIGFRSGLSFDRIGILSHITHIRGQAARLLTRRRIRELRQPPLAAGSQSLIWLDGEALCVTPEFQAALKGQGLPWLAQWHTPPVTRGPVDQPLVETLAPFARTGPATLVRRWVSRPLRRLWDRLWRRPLTSPEVRQAGLIFRLQRYGIATPRLLAVGQRHSFRGGVASFLLTEQPTGSVALTTWLTTATSKQRWLMIRAAAQLLRRLHTAGCVLNSPPGQDLHALFRVQAPSHGAPAVVLGSVAALQIQHHSGSVQGHKDLAILRHRLAPGLCSRTDQLRFVLAYQGLQRWTPEAKRLARQLLGGTRAARGAAP